MIRSVAAPAPCSLRSVHHSVRRSVLRYQISVLPALIASTFEYFPIGILPRFLQCLQMMRITESFLVYAFLLVLCKCEDDASAGVSDEVEELKRTGGEYLRRVMERLQSERNEGMPVELTELSDPDEVPMPQPADHHNYVTLPPRNATSPMMAPAPPPSPALQAEIVPSSVVSVPDVPLGLTAEELTAIYNAAITKLANLPQYHTPIQTVSELHHPPPPPPPPAKSPAVKPASHGPVGGLLPGYYYYYYPIRSFIKTYSEPASIMATTTTTTTTAKPVLMHATVHMTEASHKSVEPLFMAISGFIGMALMFAFSVLFVPKFGKLRSGELNVKGSPGDLIALGRVVFDSMEGKDCAERLACELGRILRGMKMDNKPLRVLEIVLPPKLGKQIALVRKAAAKREKCNAIPCKFKKPEVTTPKPHKAKTKTAKPWKTAHAAHELWMKHFQNRTRFQEPENIWERNRWMP